ncbi:uncharacterized protein TM35_000691070, partial [Trypanosoma theileri]
VRLEMEHLAELRARCGQTREEAERRAWQQTVRLRKQLDTAHEMRERMRDGVSQWRMKVRVQRRKRKEGGGGGGGEVAAESPSQQTQENQQQQEEEYEVELHRIHRDTLKVSQKLMALRQERDELEPLKE